MKIKKFKALSKLILTFFTNKINQISLILTRQKDNK